MLDTERRELRAYLKFGYWWLDVDVEDDRLLVLGGDKPLKVLAGAMNITFQSRLKISMRDWDLGWEAVSLQPENPRISQFAEKWDWMHQLRNIVVRKKRLQNLWHQKPETWNEAAKLDLTRIIIKCTTKDFHHTTDFALPHKKMMKSNTGRIYIKDYEYIWEDDRILTRTCWTVWGVVSYWDDFRFKLLCSVWWPWRASSAVEWKPPSKYKFDVKVEK